MFTWTIFFLALLRLAALVSAVPPLFRREEICVSIITKTVVVTSTADSAPSPSSSNSYDDNGDVLTVLITSTITVTSTIRHDSSEASQTTPAKTFNRPSPSSSPSGVNGAQSALTTQSGPDGVTVTVVSTVISVSTETLIQTRTVTETVVASESVSATTASSNGQVSSNSDPGSTAVPSTTLQPSSIPYYGNGTGYTNSSTIAATSRTILPSSSVIATLSSSVGASSPSSSPGSSTVSNSSSGYENAVYFTNWGIYSGNYQPQSLPVSQITRVHYAFADINTENGSVVSSDTYADLEKHYSTDSWSETGNNAYGCVKQLYLLKQQDRSLKVILSIGGWTYSPKFSTVAADTTLRGNFVSSAVQLVTDWGFDGVDIDWEFNAYTPASGDAQNFVLLLQELRTAFDEWAASHAPGYHFLVTVASPAGPATYEQLELGDMAEYVDSWNLMSYDYAGSWSDNSGHQANIYFDSSNMDATPYSTDQAVKAYLASGIAPSSIILGLPLYGRSFEDTTGIGDAYNGVGPGDGTFGVGQWRYKDLPRPGAVEHFDNVADATYSYDTSTEELISYDNVHSTIVKSTYLKGKGLGGAMFWSIDSDKTGSESLVATMAGELGPLDGSQNLLNYPTSQYDNIRDEMTGS